MARQRVLLPDYRLTTAEILYRLPDHPGLLQSYLWQDYDIAPDYPVLAKFLAFWTRNLEGRLHSVTVGSASMTSAPRFGGAALALSLH
ncbi:MAG: usg protein [Kiloniellales bacterium]